MSIQPVNKAVEYLISSTPVLERKKEEEEKNKRAVNAYLTNNSKGVCVCVCGGGGGGGGGGHSHKQLEGLGRVVWVYTN